MTLAVDQIKQLTAKYPYLKPVNVWTGEVITDYDYSYIISDYQLPEGWKRLFLLLCKELQPHLARANLLDKFYFTQLKEKYGTMRVYTSCLPDSVGHLVTLYECFSKQVCQFCGEKSSLETSDWITFLCSDCNKKLNDDAVMCKHDNILTLACFDKKHGHHKVRISYRPLKRTYAKVQKMSDDEFIQYLLNT